MDVATRLALASAQPNRRHIWPPLGAAPSFSLHLHALAVSATATTEQTLRRSAFRTYLRLKREADGRRAQHQTPCRGCCCCTECNASATRSQTDRQGSLLPLSPSPGWVCQLHRPRALAPSIVRLLAMFHSVFSVTHQQKRKCEGCDGVLGSLYTGKKFTFPPKTFKNFLEKSRIFFFLFQKLKFCSKKIKEKNLRHF